MENNNKSENNNLENVNNNGKDNDSDLYANPFSNSQEIKDKNIENNNSQNDVKENGINENQKNIKNSLNNEQKIEDNFIKQIKENNNKNIDLNNKNSNNNSINNDKKIPEAYNSSKEKSNPKTSPKKPKFFLIKETGSHIYIENKKKISAMAIEKSFNKIYNVKDFNEMMNLNEIKTYSVDAILGIIDINGNNKYILVVSKSNLIANIIGADIYNILDVDLIKITLFNESENEKNRINGVKTLFQSKNFYYSNQIDLCQNLSIKNRKNIINDCCVNSSLLKYFFDNLIPSEFYTKIIYGYVGFKKNIELKNDKNYVLIDNLIIERVNKHLKFNSEIANHMKEIEFICMYKKNNMDSYADKKYNVNIFTFVFYVSNEIANSKVAFNPWNNFIMNELSQYPNIVCIINNNINMNLNNNININDNSIKNIIFNSNAFGSKIKLLNFTSEWKKNLFFDNNNNSNQFIKSGSINPNHIQDNVFWFIDINNQFHENDYCFNTIIRLMWKSIQQQIDIMNLGFNIGQFNKNNNELICNQFKEMIMNYHNDLDMNKKSIYKSQMKKQLQKVFDYYFNNYINTNKAKANIYDNNFNNNINNNQSSINFENQNNFNNNNFNAYQPINKNPQINQNFHVEKSRTQVFNPHHNHYNKNNFSNNKPSVPPKLNVLCITWNTGGISSDNQYVIGDLFTQNIFYKTNKIPDIIIIGLQEIVELDIYNILSITTNEDSVSNWTKNITSTLNSIFPYTFKQISVMNLVGIYCICFAQAYLKDNIEIIDSNVIKTGLFGTLGNKGYLSLNLRLNKSMDISFAVGHLEAGQYSNDQRISTLKQILDTKIGKDDMDRYLKKFKNSDVWIILGDLNFRIEASFEKSFELIHRKDYDNLLSYDQLYLSRRNDSYLNNLTEAKINFAPTYKYISGSNNYINDIENLRTPSWTDRVLYSNNKYIRNINYSSIPQIMYSDHRPVQACFEIYFKQQEQRMGPINNFNYNLNNNNNQFNNNRSYYGNNFNNNIGNNTNNNYNMNNNFRNNNNFNNNDFRNNNNKMNSMIGNWNNNNLNNMNNNRNNINFNNNIQNGNFNIDSNKFYNNNINLNHIANSMNKNIFNNLNNHNNNKLNMTSIMPNNKDNIIDKNKKDDDDNIEDMKKFF